MKPRYRRGGDADQPDVPAPAQPIIHVPHVRVAVAPDGALSVTVDGAPFTAPEALRPLRRDTFGALADHLTAALDSPIRVEVHEADGSTFTDVATPPTPAPAAAGQPPAPLTPALAGAGFQPGEEVALAYVVVRQNADDKGNASLNLPPALLATTRDGLVLLGMSSMTVTPFEAPA